MRTYKYNAKDFYRENPTFPSITEKIYAEVLGRAIKKVATITGIRYLHYPIVRYPSYTWPVLLSMEYNSSCLNNSHKILDNYFTDYNLRSFIIFYC